MKIKDPTNGTLVDMLDKDCLQRKCYWPRPDPGAFTQGQGYRQRSGGNRGWLCGEREARGCPSAGSCQNTLPDGQTCNTSFVTLQKTCSWCHAPIPQNEND